MSYGSRDNLRKVYCSMRSISLSRRFVFFGLILYAAHVILMEEQATAPLIVDFGSEIAQQAISQPETKRLWAGEIKKLLFTIGGDEKSPLLFRPIKVTTDHKDNIYILDFDDRRVKKFSKEGRYVQTIGFGRGQGPGEFSNPTDFDIGPNGSVWVCDPVNGYITVFNESGAVEKTIRLAKETPLRIAVKKNGYFVVRAAQIGEYLFSAYGREGNLVRRFGNLFENQARIEVALDGMWTKDATDYFVFVFYRVGAFVVYHAQSLSTEVYAQTINSKGFPSILTIQRGDTRITRLDKNAPYTTLSASIVGEEIHLLVGNDGESNKSVIDAYDLRSGMYRKSYSIPSDVSFAHITHHRVYTIQDTTVRVWSR